MRAALLGLLIASAAAGLPQSPANAQQAQPSFPPEYAAMREGARAFAADIARDEQRGRAMAGNDGVDPWFDTLDCAPPDIEPIKRSQRQLQVEALAHEAMVLEARLRAFGYAPGISSEPLRRYQLAALQVINSGKVPSFGQPGYDSFEKRLSSLHVQLSAELEANRRRLQPRSLPIRREGGCGAAESPVIIKADPPGGRIWVITRFSFDVCRAKKLDPWNIEACRWAEMDPRQEAWLSGTYMVQGKWPNGASVRTNRRIVGDDPDESITVTIRPG